MKIGIVGVGVIGVTSGIRLLEAGHEVKLFSRDDPDRTTSSVAAAYWDPTHEGPPARAPQWVARSLEVFQQQSKRPEAGIDFAVFHEMYDDDPGYSSALKYLRPLPASELRVGTRFGYRADIPRIDVPTCYPYLLKQLESLGGNWQKKELGSLEELAAEHDLIVNCSGVWASRLAPDPTVRPARGQVIRIQKPPGLDSTIFCVIGRQEITYVVPRRNDCILGGTKHMDNWNLEPDPKIAAEILERCQKLVPQIKDVSILEHRAGLRPARDAGTRLELDRLATGKPVIHNYGHRGAGWALPWGCADEVVTLAAQAA